MSTPTTTLSVALLFADADLGSPLREALVALGARIAYEGPAADVDEQDLITSGADVVVVNLEPTEEDDLERLHDMLGNGDWRVIFNDAEASRDLSGWDRARWARHLAAKLLGAADVDPPRPEAAREVEVAMAVAGDEAPVPAAPAVGDMTSSPVDMPVTEAVPPPAGAGTVASAPEARSEALEAELEALMSAERGTDIAADADTDIAAPVEAAGEDAPTAQPATPEAAPVEIEERQTVAAPAPVAEWELLDFGSTPQPAEREHPGQYGIEKIEASDYLAPEGGEGDSELEPGLNLELVSLEESVAPVISDEAVSEMLLDESASGIRRVVVVAAGRGSGSEIGEFLAHLPRALPALVLIVQHQRPGELDALAQLLAMTTSLGVKTASGEAVARMGEVWLVPPGKYCRLRRDGRMSVADDASGTRPHAPSIDLCVEHLAPAFGRDVTLVVMSGAGHDALAAAQLVASQGGNVWLHEAAAATDDSMARAIDEEGLADDRGTPVELAVRLSEDKA